MINQYIDSNSSVLNFLVYFFGSAGYKKIRIEEIIVNEEKMWENKVSVSCFLST
ncbi:MAG: hypothetical protein H7Y03_00755 [Chitinophagaceae bacterium]|nr:hypothetical protein [Chitinophagaceae bacterium]